MTTLLLYTLATGVTAFVQSHLELAAVRFIAGLGLGGELPVVASYVSELSPPERKVLLESFWSLGALAAAAVAYFLFPALGLRNAMLLLAATALYAAVIRGTLPEHKPQRGAALSIYAYFRRLVPTWYMWFALAFGCYGIFLWLPTILVRERGSPCSSPTSLCSSPRWHSYLATSPRLFSWSASAEGPSPPSSSPRRSPPSHTARGLPSCASPPWR